MRWGFREVRLRLSLLEEQVKARGDGPKGIFSKILKSESSLIFGPVGPKKTWLKLGE